MPINEQLNFSVSFAGAVKASASTTINDTSRPAYDYILVSDTSSVTPITESNIPTYHLASNVSVANEGDSVTFTLTTTMLDSNTSIPYTITGISAADLSAGSLTGNFVTDDTGKATTTVTLADDKLTEGTESLVITLNGKTTFKEVSILDTSKTPTYDVGWYGNAAGTGNKLTSVSEGHAPYLVVLTTDVADGTVLNFAITGTGFTSADVGGAPLSANMTITGNRGYYLYNVTVDHATEGDETITATVKLNTSTIGTATLTVMDTSKAPTFTAGWYANSNGTTPITSINEGSTAYLVVTTTDVTDNTGLGIQFSGAGIALADMSGSAATSTLSSAVNIVNNTGYLAVPIIADQSLEGNETLVTKVSYFGTEVASLNLTINDTSTAPYDGGEVIFTMAKTPTYGIPVTNTRSYSVYVNSPPYTMPSPIGTFHSDTLMLNGIAAQIDSISVYSVGAGYEDWFVYIDVRGQGSVGDVGNRNIVVTRVDNGAVLANSRLTNDGGGGVRFSSTPVGQSSEFTLPVGVMLKLTIVKV